MSDPFISCMKHVFSNLLGVDIYAFFLISQRIESRLALRFFEIVSRSADGYYYPLLALVLIVADLKIGLAFLVAGLIAFAIELPLYRVLKDSIKRDRPANGLKNVLQRIQPPDQFSFPSGHTAAAVMIASMISVYVPGLAFGFWVWAVMVGLSRVYLAVHYPSDVVAGALLGLMSSTIGIELQALLF